MSGFFDYLFRSFTGGSPATRIVQKASQDYLYDTHPRTRAQFDFQMGVASIVPQYGAFMRAKAENEKMQDYMRNRKILWSDVKYPWISMAGTSTASTIGG